MLVAAGLVVQSRDALNLHAAQGVAEREVHLQPSHGVADYLLFVEAQAVGVIEAKQEDTTLSGVEIQTEQLTWPRELMRRVGADSRQRGSP